MAALSLMFQARNFFFYMILIIFMLGFGSCQRSTLSHDSRMPSRFYIDPEQKSSPMEMFGKLDSFDTWKPRLLNQMRNDLGNVWFSVKLPESDHEKVLEFQTLNLIDLEAYWIKEDGSFQTPAIGSADVSQDDTLESQRMLAQLIKHFFQNPERYLQRLFSS